MNSELQHFCNKYTLIICFILIVLRMLNEIIVTYLPHKETINYLKIFISLWKNFIQIK